jgi:hypothetical protein
MRKFWACGDPGDYDSCTGLVKDMLDYLVTSLNASISVFVPDSYLLGRELDNGTWVGGVKHVSGFFSFAFRSLLYYVNI